MTHSIPIPERMKALPIDRRGFPIPWIVYRDLDGLPHFAINQEHLRHQCVNDDLCSICKGKLLRGRWWVGGALSAFHQHGAFIDPPMHNECAHYALQVCPYIAMPHYVREIGLAKAKTGRHGVLVVADNTMMPGRPAGDVFVALMATRYTVFPNLNTKPRLPYSRVEYWRHGVRIPDAEGVANTERALAELATRPAGPP